MGLPERVFVIVIESVGGHDPDRMPLLTRKAGDVGLSPAFSTMLLATSFLAQAQELGQYIKLDYIFPADGRRLTADFPDHQFVLDMSPQAFFNGDAEA